MTTPIDFGNCSQAVPHERRFNPRAKPKKSPGPGSYDIINTPTDVTTKYKTTPTYKMGSSTAPRFNKKADCHCGLLVDRSRQCLVPNSNYPQLGGACLHCLPDANATVC